MEQLIKEVEAYAKLVGKHPSTILQVAANLSGGRWAKWLEGSGCSMKVAERIRKYIKENPPLVAV